MSASDSTMASIMKWRNSGIVLLSIVCFSLHSAPLNAQPSMNPTAADTSSPRSMLKSFIDACNELHQQIQNEHYLDSNNPQHIAVQTRILDCIDASDLPAFERKERAAEAAICLKEILDRHQLPSWDEIPDTAEIESAGGLEKFSFWRIPGTRITIARVEEGPQKHEYLFSTGTVDRAADYFGDVQASPYRTDGPLTSPNLYKWYAAQPIRCCGSAAVAGQHAIWPHSQLNELEMASPPCRFANYGRFYDIGLPMASCDHATHTRTPKSGLLHDNCLSSRRHDCAFTLRVVRA